MLKTSYKTQEEIPENQRGAYVLSGTEWVLDGLADDHPVLVKNKALLSENASQKASITRLTNEKSALEGSVLPTGQVAIPQADAEFIEKVKPLGSATEIVTKLAEHKSLKYESDTRKSQDHLRAVAKELEYEPEAFLLFPNLPEFDIRDGAEGKKTVIAKIKGEGNTITEKPAKEFIESAPQYAPLLPALKLQEGGGGTRVFGSRSNAISSSTDAGDPIAVRNKAREDARKANPNPLMAKPAIAGAAALGAK